MTQYLEFEKPLAEIEGKANELRAMALETPEAEVGKEADQLDQKAADLLDKLYASLTPWQVMVIGHEKGNDTKSRIERNFGMARPEGYRKAIRLMDMADRFGLPVITLVDTPGAYPGKGAEERGQSGRRRLWRGGGFCDSQPRGDAGTFHLFGHQPRRLRIDPVERRRQSQ